MLCKETHHPSGVGGLVPDVLLHIFIHTCWLFLVRNHQSMVMNLLKVSGRLVAFVKSTRNKYVFGQDKRLC